MPAPHEIPANLDVTVVDHPLAASRLSTMRDARTDNATFRAALRELTLMLIYEASRTLATERLRHLQEFAEEERRGRDPEELEAEASELREEEMLLADALEQARLTLQSAVTDRQQGERDLADL